MDLLNLGFLALEFGDLQLSDVLNSSQKKISQDYNNTHLLNTHSTNNINRTNNNKDNSLPNQEVNKKKNNNNNNDNNNNNNNNKNNVNMNNNSDCENSKINFYKAERRKYLTLISLTELSWHDNINDCWIAINDYVYDCTEFIKSHPGGVDIILEYAGRDATIAFIGTGHSSAAFDILNNYLIGELPIEERLFRKENGIKLCLQ